MDRCSDRSRCLPVADFDTWLACKPQVALSQLLTARADGSLLSLLKREGLGTAIEVGVEEQTRSFAVVTASLALTEAGLAAWPTAMGHLFSYLRLCREKGVPSHVFDDAKALAQLGFRYAEPSQPQAFVTATAASMPLYRPAAWLSGPSLLEGAGGPPTLRQLLGGMTPRAAMVEVCAKEVAPKAPLSEQIYGTRYGRQPIEGEVAAWEAAPLLPELSLPRPNPFIPKRLAIKAPQTLPRKEGVPSPTPSLLPAADGARVHFLADRTFGRPRAFAYFLWRSPEFYTSARTAVTAELFAGMLAEVLQEATYEAAQAGLVAASGVSSDAFTVQLGGYDERLPALATLVASTVRSFEPTQAAFERKVDILRRQLRDAERRQPISLAGYRRGLALQPARFSNEQLAAAAGEVSLSDVAAMQEGVLREAQLEAFVAGNLRENEAAEMVRGVRAALPAAPLAAERLPIRRLRRLPPGGATRQFLAGNPEEPNGALEMYLQVGPDEGDDWLHLLLLSQMIDKAVYAELRTKQQLGYIVQCGSTEADGVRGLVFIVQSSVQPPPELEARLEAFLRLFRGTLLLTSDEELDTYRESLAAQMQDVDQRADGQASRLWAEVATRRYDFGRPWRSSKRMRRVTRDGLIGFYDKYIAAGGAGRCRLSTHVFSQRSPPKGPLRDDPLPDAFFPPTADGFGVDWAADRAVV